jgi:LysR family transcriptional regulator, cyn operon transcriptional activator
MDGRDYASCRIHCHCAQPARAQIDTDDDVRVCLGRGDSTCLHLDLIEADEMPSFPIRKTESHDRLSLLNHRDDMTIRQLEMFKAIVDTGRFTGAAEKLHVAQPSVSQQIRQLEEELGVSLFLRLRNRRLMLTDAGRVLNEHANIIFRQCETARIEISALTSEPVGQVRIGLGGHQLTSMLPPALSDFHRRFPKVSVDIVNSTTPQLIASLRSNQLDLAVVNFPVNVRELRTELLFREELVVVVQAKGPLAKQTAIEPAELGRLQLVLYDQSTSMRRRLDDFFSQHGIRPQISFELSSVEAMKRMVQAGLGATIVPHSAVVGRTKHDGLHVLQIRGTTLARSVGLAWPELPRLPNVIEWMVDKLKERFQEIERLLERERGAVSGPGRR